jgi:hypothetical protein
LKLDSSFLKRSFPALLGTLSIILLFAAAWTFRPTSTQPTTASQELQTVQTPEGFLILGSDRVITYQGRPFTAAALLLIVIGCGLAFATLLFTAPPLLKPQTKAPLHGKVRWHFNILGAACLWAFGEINTGYLLQLDPISHHLQMGLFAAALLLLGFGLRPSIRLTTKDLVLVVALIGLGMVVRVWQLGTLIHRPIDEIPFIATLNEMEKRPALLLQPFGEYAVFPRIFSYLLWLGVEVGGHNYTGLRLASVVMGTLTIPALYVFAKEWGDQKIALIAALLLAVFPPHIHFSRIAVYNIADPLWGVLSMALLSSAIRTGTLGYYGLAGIFLGMTQYFYEGGRLFYPLLFLLWLCSMALFGSIRPHRKGVFIFLLMAAVVALPFWYSNLLGGNTLAPRLGHERLPSRYYAQLLLAQPSSPILAHHMERISEAFRLYIQTPENGWFYAGKTPLLLWYVVPFFLLGCTYALFRIRHTTMQMLLASVFFAATANTFLVRNAEAPRYVVVFPSLVLLTALGVCCAGAWIQRRYRPVIFGGLLSILLIGQFDYYFFQHLPDYNAQYPVTYDVFDAVIRTQGLPPQTPAYLVTGVVVYDADIRVLEEFWGIGGQVILVIPPQELPAQLAALSPRESYAFFVSPQDQESIESLRSRFFVAGPFSSPYSVPRSKQLLLYLLKPL